MMDAKTAENLLTLLSSREEIIWRCETSFWQEDGNFTVTAMLDNLANLLQTVETQVSAEPVPNRVKEINLNLYYYLEQLKGARQNTDSVLFDLHYHLKLLFRILEFEIAYIVEDYVDKNAYPAFYPDNGRIDHQKIIQQGENAKYQVSVVLLAYNNLSYVRNCVKSILENTEEIHYELILVDNGSTDGTGAYFDSIKDAKVIHLKYNLHVVKGFNIGLMAAEGKYSAAICNDFIFTKNWLGNLLTCMESDPGIGYASPGATNISNLQRISIPFTSIERFQEEAGKFNISDPRKWEERVVLLPNVLCCPTALLQRIGYYDTRFYRGEFADDDISFRIRRAGYKLIYCADTVTHHYGSVTTAKDHQNNSFQEGKETFFQKYGLDAWADARMDPIYQNFSYEQLSHVSTILGIEVKCGATLLQIKNTIWNNFGIHPTVSAAVTEEKYLADLQTISADSFVIQNFSCFPEKFCSKFDLIYIEKSLDCCAEDLDTVFSGLSKLIRPQGQLIFRLDNCSSFSRIINLLQSDESVHNKKNYLEESVCSTGQRYGFRRIRTLGIMNKEFLQTIEKLSQAITGENETSQSLQKLLQKETTYYQMLYNG